MTTLCFSDIFKSYADFKTFTAQFKLYEANNQTAEAFNQHLYNCLANRYFNQSLAYDTPEEFKAEFAIAYNQYFQKFLTKQNILAEIYNLTIDDYTILSESISNFSNNPNYINQDAWETITYISNQQRGRAKAGKLIGYINALREMPDAQIDAMLKSFDYLWLDILGNEDYYLFTRGNETC